MRIVVDTNRILSALLKEGTDRKIISSQNIDFFSLGYALDEIENHMDYIIGKSGLPKENVDTLLNLIMEKIDIVPHEEIEAKMNEAMEIIEKIDQKDAPILACALAIQNDGIWSEDKHLHKQKRVKAWHSEDLLEYI